MKTSKILVLLLSLVIIISTSCQKGEKKDAEKDTTSQQIPDLPEEDDILVYPLPTPFEVTNLIQSTGSAYNISIANDINNASNYSSQKAQALNLGIYGADLAYASTYNQAQNTRDYINVVKKLSDELGLSDAIDKKLMERFEQNIENSDSIYKIVTNSYARVYNSLYKQGKQNSALLVITGAWVESLYLATQIAQTAQKPEELRNKLGEQKFNYNTLMDILKEANDDKTIQSVYDELSSLKEIMDKITVDDDDNTTMSKETFDELSKSIAEIRNQYVNMQ